MAENEDLMKEIHDQFLVCKICFEIYTDPKTLVCLHSFCFICLQKHVNSAHSRSHRLYTRYVTCPLCRSKTDIPNGGVRKLPSNFLLSNLADILHKKNTRRNCDICPSVSTSPGKKAFSRCIECSKVLCESCVVLHQETNVTRNHSLVEVYGEGDVQCKFHSNEIVRFYCETCQTCVCVVCTFQEHKMHEVLSFNEVHLKHKDDLSAELDKGVEKLEHLRSSMAMLEEYEMALNESKQSIRDCALEQIRKVRQTEKQLIQEIDDLLSKDQMLQFVQTKDLLRKNIENFQNTCNVAHMLTKGGSVAMLIVKREIQQRLSQLFTMEIPCIPKPAGQPCFIPGSTSLGHLRFLTNRKVGFNTDFDESHNFLSDEKNISLIGKEVNVHEKEQQNQQSSNYREVSPSVNDVNQKSLKVLASFDYINKSVQTDEPRIDLEAIIFKNDLSTVCKNETRDSECQVKMKTLNKSVMAQPRYCSVETNTILSNLYPGDSLKKSDRLRETLFQEDGGADCLLKLSINKDNVILEDKGVNTSLPNMIDNETLTLTVEVIESGVNTNQTQMIDMSIETDKPIFSDQFTNTVTLQQKDNETFTINATSEQDTLTEKIMFVNSSTNTEVYSMHDNCTITNEIAVSSKGVMADIINQKPFVTNSNKTKTASCKNLKRKDFCDTGMASKTSDSLSSIDKATSTESLICIGLTNAIHNSDSYTCNEKYTCGTSPSVNNSDLSGNYDEVELIDQEISTDISNNNECESQTILTLMHLSSLFDMDSDEDLNPQIISDLLDALNKQHNIEMYNNQIDHLEVFREQSDFVDPRRPCCIDRSTNTARQSWKNITPTDAMLDKSTNTETIENSDKFTMTSGFGINSSRMAECILKLKHVSDTLTPGSSSTAEVVNNETERKNKLKNILLETNAFQEKVKFNSRKPQPRTTLGQKTQPYSLSYTIKTDQPTAGIKMGKRAVLSQRSHLRQHLSLPTSPVNTSIENIRDENISGAMSISVSDVTLSSDGRSEFTREMSSSSPSSLISINESSKSKSPVTIVQKLLGKNKKKAKHKGSESSIITKNQYSKLESDKTPVRPRKPSSFIYVKQRLFPIHHDDVTSEK